MNNIGYAVITTEEYKEMIEDIKNKEEVIRELDIIDRKENERNRIYENLFIKKLLENEDYHLKEMKECKVTDYHYQQIFDEFLKIGISDTEYIDLKIKEMKHIYDTQNEEKQITNKEIKDE